MRNGAKDRAKTLEDIRKFVRIVRERTLHGFVLSGDVFKGQDKHGNQITLGKQCDISNENSLNVFVLAKFLQVDDSRGRHKGGKFIKWCGPNLSIFDLTDLFIKVRNEYMNTRPHRNEKNKTLPVEKTQPVTEKTQPVSTNILNQEFVPITYKEFTEKIYTKPSAETLSEALLMLIEIHKNTLGISRTSDEVFNIRIPIIFDTNSTPTGWEIRDVRDMFVPFRKQRNTVFSTELLLRVKALKKDKVIDDKYEWNASEPDIPMVEIIYRVHAYQSYIIECEKEFNKVKIAAEEAKKAEEIRLAEEVKKAEEIRLAEEKRLLDEADEAAVRAEIEAEEAEEARRVEANSKISKVEETDKPILLHQKVIEVSSDEVSLVDFEKMTIDEKLVLIYQNQLKNRGLLQSNSERLANIETYQGKQSANLVTVADILGKVTV